MYKFKFADIGEGLHEGTVGEIYLKVGDSVKEGESLFEVETDKVTSDIPSPTTGKITKILIKTGETVTVGDEIFYIDDGSASDSTPAAEPQKVETKEAAAPVASQPVAKGGVEKEVRVEKSSPQVNVPAFTPGAKVLSTPYARKLAVEKGIDINKVGGSGFNNRVLANDILNFRPGVLNGSNAEMGSNAQPFPAYSQKDSGIRKAIAKAMKNSWDNVAYTQLVNEINMTKLWDERKALVKETLAKYGTKVSFTALIAMGAIAALRKYPMFNSKHNDKTGELVGPAHVNLGIAVDTPHGLFVPVIKNADSKTVVQISQEIGELAKKAKDKKLTMEDMTGATFTISNYGSAGAMWGIPIINYPELSILGTGTIVDRVYADSNGNFYNGKVMHLNLAADHRWVDGADIGRFLVEMKNILENPILILGGI